MKKVLNFSLLLIFIFIFKSVPCFAQQNLSLTLDVCQYRFNQDSSLVEIYYNLLAAEKERATTPSEYVLELRITQDEKVIISNLWKVQGEKSDSENKDQSKMIVDVLRYLIPSGDYNIKLIAKNLFQTNDIDSITISNYSVRKFGKKNIEMSDIEIAQKIVPSAQNKTKFNKNRYTVTPNPAKIFAKENPDVYYYFESYNILKNLTENILKIKRTVLDMYGLPLPSLPDYIKKKRIRGNDDVEVGMLNISALPSGKYYFNFSIIDSSGKDITSTNTAFFVHNPDVAPINRNNLSIETQVSSSEIALLQPDDLEIMVNASKYLIEDEEIKVLNNLANDNAKKIFLYRFWKERDSNPTTRVFESYREMLKRVQYANSNFSSIKKEGWQSDRGRILIKYGNPSEIQYYNNIAEFKEFQAWSYDHIESGVVFIFGVIGAFGDLKLIHSTKTGEPHNEFWLEMLMVSESSLGMQETELGGSNREAYRDIFRRNNIEMPRYLR